MSRPEKTDPTPPLQWMWANVFGKGDADQAAILESIEKIPLFQGLTKKELSRVEESLYLRKYRANSFIFRAGEPGLGMYIIHAGSVWIQRSEEADSDPFLELGPGDFFGEMALFEEKVHLVSARAHTHTALLGFFRPDLMTLSHYYPRLGCKLFLALGRVISDRFRASLTGAPGRA
jgi:CRP/FNR family cyclic AMP-dependent transcriptional regulator